MTAMLTNLRNINEIGGNASAPNIKESKKVANETLRYIMELATGGVICNKAFEVVTQKKEQLDTLKMLDERIDARKEEEEEITIEGVR
jgi:hypothetical protein